MQAFSGLIKENKYLFQSSGEPELEDSESLGRRATERVATSPSAALPVASPVFLGLPPHLYSTVTEHQHVPGTVHIIFSIHSPVLKSRCCHSTFLKELKNHRALESKEENDFQRSLGKTLLFTQD